MTASAALARIKALSDITAQVSPDGEYRVSLKLASIRRRHGELTLAQAAARQEAVAHYTDDADDALFTAAAISAHFALHGAL